MQEGPRTFRDQFLSIYQSAVADLARRVDAERGAGDALEGAAESTGASLEAAAERVAERMHEHKKQGGSAASFDSEEAATLESMSPLAIADVCASLGLRYLQAKVLGDSATADLIKSELKPGSKCDPKWVQTLEDYLKYFGPTGTRREIPYVKPGDVGPQVITIKSNAKIGLIGDWGTGAEPARRVLRQLKAQRPDIVIHLGDIYYSGTDTECRTNFEAVVNQVLERSQTGIPVYALAGNHDMYSGGVGYYDLIKRLNRPPMVQPASFFCLRTEDQSWQLLAMDTGQHDYSPFSVSDVLTFVDQAERDWHEQRIREFPGKTILLSHHQLFSAFSKIGERGANGKHCAHNPELKKAFDQFRGTGKDIAAWFWGHEHNLSIYKSYLGLERGRCLGHSAIPVFVGDEPYTMVNDLDDPPGFVDTIKLSKTDDIYAHGFATIALAPGTAAADYFEDRAGAAVKIHSETID
jgi:predicted phosphodiesterase